MCCFRRCATLLSFALVLLTTPLRADEERPRRVPITPPWALECWLWEDDHNTAAGILELLDGYEKHDIPARTIIIDAPWATRYNDFRIDENRYPEPEKFFRELKERGIRIVMWMTPMVNSECNDCLHRESHDWFEEARRNGYLAGGGYQQKWWHGWGGFIDYANPAAMQWWRGMQQQVFDWGIDGWKLDGAALYFNSPVGALVGTKNMPPRAERADWMKTRDYMNHYYRGEYQHGLKQRNGDFITLARSIDTQIHPEGFAPLDAAPVTWVGDQKHTWKFHEEGIEEALHFILQAARIGYCVIGSDVGGYHGSMPIPTSLHMRWAQFSCFCGLFLNGGHGERRIWLRDERELPIMRKFAWLHNELVPFMYSHVVECHHGGQPLMRPLGPSRHGMDTASFHYMFGDDFLVAPIYEDSLTRQVDLPAGKWRYLFDDQQLLEGPATLTRDFPLDEFPVYVRQGALVPLDVKRPYTGLGDRDSDGFITWMIYPGADSSFTLHHTDGEGASTLAMSGDQRLRLEFTGRPHPHILRIYLDQQPARVLRNGDPLPGDAWRYDADDHRLWIRSADGELGTYEIVP